MTRRPKGGAGVRGHRRYAVLCPHMSCLPEGPQLAEVHTGQQAPALMPVSRWPRVLHARDADRLSPRSEHELNRLCQDRVPFGWDPGGTR